MGSLLRDIKLALRQIRNRPLWSMAIVMVLAVGIGANTAMYSGFEAWVLRPLDLRNPEKLVSLNESQPLQGRLRVSVSPRNLGDWIAQQQSFDEVAAFRRVTVNLSDTEEPVRIEATQVDASLFLMLGREPALGRSFGRDDDLPGQAAKVALISDDLWRERYAADPEIVGKTIRLDGRVHEVLGVMPPKFAFPEWSDAWTPLGLDTASGSRSDRSLSVLARLGNDASIESSQAEMTSIAKGLERLYPETNRGWDVQILSLREEWVPPVIEIALAASMGAALLVLLVICANVGGLVLAQASLRQREFALRAALGATRRRLAQQSVVEITVLAICAGVLGLAFARFGVRAMLSTVPVDPPYLFEMSFSPLAAFLTFAVALMAGVLCGCAPLSNRTRGNFESLKSGGRAGQSRQLARARSTLVIGELALSTALVVGALLLAKSFFLQQSSARGFDSAGVVTTELALTGVGFEEPAQRREIAWTLLSKLSEAPGIGAVGLTTGAVSAPSTPLWLLETADSPAEPGEGVAASTYAATGGYFEVLGIDVIAGRNFTASEDEIGAPSALLSASLAEQLWPSGDAIGRALKRGLPDAPWLTVVGIVNDVEVGRDMVDFGSATKGQIYVPWAGQDSPVLTVAVRGLLLEENAASAVRDSIRNLLPDLPISEVLTIRESLHRAGWVSHFFGKQLGLYAALAMLIAAIGLYGLMADSVSRRVHELATRAAFGARRSDLVLMILREAVKLGAAGIVAGVALAVATTRLGSSMLVGVDVLDPAVFAGVVLLLLTVTLLAALLPAVRAARMSPSAALRAE